MTRTLYRIFCLVGVTSSTLHAQQTREAPLSSRRASQVADSILRLMTLEEKVGQLNQLPGQGTPTGPHAPQGVTDRQAVG